MTRLTEVHVIEILIILVIAVIVFWPMLMKARKNTGD
jgi:Sec-independent protein translocase protein TatA